MCQCLACSCCTTCLTLSEVLVIGFPVAVQFLDGSGRRADLSPEVDPVIYKYCIGNVWLCHTWSNLTIICTLNCWSKLFVNYKISHLVYFVLMIFHLLYINLSVYLLPVHTHALSTFTRLFHCVRLLTPDRVISLISVWPTDLFTHLLRQPPISLFELVCHFDTQGFSELPLTDCSPGSGEDEPQTPPVRVKQS